MMEGEAGREEDGPLEICNPTKELMGMSAVCPVTTPVTVSDGVTVRPLRG